MDNLTHSLTGVFLSRAGLNRLAPDTMPILLLAANAPDVDVVTGFSGPAALLHWHRNITHSLTFSPVLALLCVGLVRAISRRKAPWAGSILAAWLGVLSHLLLDLTNNYGVRLLEPFSSRWFEWDITYVIDPWIWCALLLSLFAPLLGRILSSEIGESKRSQYPPRGWAVFALGFILLFDGARVVLHRRAVETLNARIYDGEEALRVAAFPTPLSPLQWDALVETSLRYYVYDFNLSAIFSPDMGKSFARNNPGNAVNALSKLTEFNSLIEFAQYPLWRTTEDENNSRYTLTDLRFGDPVQQTFTCSARLSGRHEAADERCDFSFSPNFKKQ